MNTTAVDKFNKTVSSSSLDPFNNKTLTLQEKTLLKIVKCGPVPEHVAFIMDGNRRWARNNNIGNETAYKRGSDKIGAIMSWSTVLGIREVTCYAYSIENFKRSKEEMEVTLGLARVKLLALLDHAEELKEQGICVRIVGDLTYLTPDLVDIMLRIMETTRDNSAFVLNLAIAYTNRDDMASAMKEVALGLQNGEINEEDVDEDLISDCMYTYPGRKPDILIRTSGEVRFSDFLMWQLCDGGVVHFVHDAMWPEFGLKHYMRAVFQYQKNLENIEAYTKFRSREKVARSEKVDKFVKSVHEKRWQIWKKHAEKKNEDIEPIKENL